MRFVLTTWFGLARHDNRNTLSLVLIVFHSLTSLASAQVLPNIESLLGLPRGDHCAFAYNQSLYIVGGNISDSNYLISLAIPANIITSRPTMTQINTVEQLNDTNTGCAVTSYGHALFLPSLLVLDLPSSQWVSPPTIVQYGSAPLRSTNNGNMTSAMWNDLLVVLFGGSNDTEYKQTYVLDTRQRDMWAWYPVPMTSDVPSQPSVTMTATQRWILHFSAESIYNGSSYNVSVHCFDPYLMLWLGKVVNFISPTDQLRATTFTGDQVLVMAVHTVNPFSPSRIALLPQYGLWRLNLSSDNQPQGTVHYMSPSEVGPFRPLSGQSLTRLWDGLLVFYGGLPLSHDSLRFWNGSNLSFIDPEWWKNTQVFPTYPPIPTSEPTESNSGDDRQRLLAIILGTVLGTLFLFLILLICFCCWRRQRRQRQQQTQKEDPRELSPLSTVPQHISPGHYDDSTTWATHLRRALSSIRSPAHATAATTGVPTIAASPYQGTPEMVYHPEPTIDIERQNRIRSTSRFNEHFDLIALPDSIPRDNPN